MPLDAGKRASGRRATTQTKPYVRWICTVSRASGGGGPPHNGKKRDISVGRRTTLYNALGRNTKQITHTPNKHQHQHPSLHTPAPPIHASTQASTQTSTQAHKQPSKQASTQVPKHACTQARKHTSTQASTRKYASTQASTQAHNHTSNQKQTSKHPSTQAPKHTSTQAHRPKNRHENIAHPYTLNRFESSLPTRRETSRL